MRVEASSSDVYAIAV
ncbi:unnamed protein product, partial [Rotaria sp. Silwood1]